MDAGVREAVALYQFSERIKSFLIVAFKVVEGVEGFSDAEAAVGKRVVNMLLTAIAAEARLAMRATGKREFSEISDGLMEATGLEDLKEVEARLAKLVSLAATCGGEAFEVLRRSNLI